MSSLVSRCSTLPQPLTSLVGREQEIAAVTRLFAQSGARLVTLTGTGGIGKTRLALGAAELLGDSFPDGVWFVSLASIADPDLVVPTITRALEIAEQADQPLLERLTGQLQEWQALLVLDNFEQVLAAATEIAHLLAACPMLAVLVTSREPLHLSGEHEYPVPPLQIPGECGESASTPLPDSDAIRLFVERARQVAPGFTLTPDNAPDIVEICRRLDGLPLAVELAAARIKLLSPGELLERLDQPLALLTGGPRDAPERQQTMRATLQWSYDLLPPEEQQLFRGLSVFAGGWTLTAAEAVVDGEDVLELLASLVDKGLVRRVEPPEQLARYGMLEPVRQFAWECLTEDDEEATRIRDRHAPFFQSIVKGLKYQLEGPDGPAMFARIEVEHDNLRAALRWLQESGQIEQSLLLAGDMFTFWIHRGYVGEGLTQILDLLGLPGAERRTIGRTRALWAAGWLQLAQGDVHLAFQLSDEARAIAEEQGDRLGLADALLVRGICHREAGDAGQARSDFERALPLFRELEEHAQVVRVLIRLGGIAISQGDLERSRALLEEGLALARAQRLKHVIGLVLSPLAGLAERTGDDERAADLFGDALTRYHELGVPRATAHSLERIAALLHRQPETAVCLLSAAWALRERTGATHVDPLYHFDSNEALNALRAALSDTAFEAAWAQGRAAPLEDVINLALEAIRAEHAEAASAPPGGLTPREVEVLGLLAAGKSNRQIAGELFISARTVERHVVNIYRKIDAHNRAEATAFALENNLA